ncbi:HIT family protein [Psychroserpens sp. XS_ASV72]|uniref:HIT family protein n=1 Tax=Psychroserpens sp. XS_ASV72 TaxID=3241293 RepID=UPI0035197D6B
MKNKCYICGQIEGKQENDLISINLGEVEYIRRIIAENKLFALIPSLGALNRGHSLICPKFHYRSIAEIPDVQFHEYEEFVNHVSLVLKNLYKKPIHFFEHGSNPNSDEINCTVDHAHLHVIPADVKIDFNLLNNVYKWEKVNSHEDFKELVKDKEYLYYRSPNDELYFSVAQSHKFESQYMRKVFANLLDRSDDWNWRDNPNVDFCSDDFIYMKEEFDKCLVNMYA